MNYVLTSGVVAVFGFVSLYSALAICALHSRRFARYRIRPVTIKFNSLNRHYLTIGLNGTFSIGYYFAFLFVFGDQVIHTGSIAFWTAPLQVAGILLFYDLLYYGMHRWFHSLAMFRLIHVTHHKVRYPEALDGL